ncbi:MAG: acyl-ACP--UDP-N-acetylglucosamine O-acyltransferase [Bacteroidetes bacterium]|nr:acyl-ACP--UDP-N-acetylglucosamine O-acyltransferase [Bacteroidota bacterium]
MHQPLAYVHPQAKIAQNVVIEPFVTIHKDVVIEEGTWIGPHATIMEGARIGKNCKIFPGAVISAVPQDLKFQGEYSTVEIGNNVVIREYSTINRGTVYSDKTRIGDNTLLMAYTHVAHDCVIGKNCILANNATLGGHIEVGDYAILGGMTAVHQFCKIGKHAFLAGGSLVNKDIPPFVKAARYPASYVGINSVGLRRRGYSAEQINRILEIYRILFIRGYNTTQAIRIIETELPVDNERDEIVQFVTNSNRGIMRGYKSQ